MLKQFSLFALLIFTAFGFSSCIDEPVEPNEPKYTIKFTTQPPKELVAGERVTVTINSEPEGLDLSLVKVSVEPSNAVTNLIAQNDEISFYAGELNEETKATLTVNYQGKDYTVSFTIAPKPEVPELYVSSKGKDNNQGTKNSPMTLPRAFNKARSKVVIILLDDIESEAISMAGGNITLNLNDNTISFTTPDERAITIEDGTLTLIDGKNGTGKLTRKGTTQVKGGVEIQQGTFDMKGGTITGFEYNKEAITGIGIYVSKVALLQMSGKAKISNNKSSHTDSRGGGIYLDNGARFIMEDATIEGNQLSGDKAEGGGVYACNGSAWQMLNGAIKNNEAGNGGGVYVKSTEDPSDKDGSSTFNMFDGSIESNKAENGGGLYVLNCNFPVAIKGNVSKNIATKNGGGIFCVDSYVSVNSNATISGNEATEYGGGIYASDSNCDVDDNTTIESNTAKNGGGIYFSGNNDVGLYLNESTISKNEATEFGGGVYIIGTDTAKKTEFEMESGEIKDNKAKKGGGVYLGTATTFNGTGGTLRNNTPGDYTGGTYTGSSSSKNTWKKE